MSFKLLAKVFDLNVGNPVRKIVLMRLADQANDDSCCWPSYESIARYCEISKRSAVNHVKWLEENNFIKVERRYDVDSRKNFSNKYFLTLDKGRRLNKLKIRSEVGADTSLVVKGVNSADSTIANVENTLGSELNTPSNSAGAALKSTTKPTNKSINEAVDKKDKTPSYKFIKPTLAQVEQYFAEQHHSSAKNESERFLDYYISNGWKVGKNPMKDWKATVRNWIRNSEKINKGKTNEENKSFSKKLGRETQVEYEQRMQREFDKEFGR